MDKSPVPEPDFLVDRDTLAGVMLPTLYPDQTAAVTRLRDRLRSAGVSRVCLSAPTGAGKTEIAIFMMGSAVMKGKRAWFVVDRTALVRQTCERLQSYGIPHGQLSGGNTKATWRKLVVASAQTMEARGRFPGDDEVDVVFIDECHIQRKKIVEWIKSLNCPVIGLTATPFSEGMDQVWHEVVQTVTTDRLIGDRLAPLRIYIAAALFDMTGARGKEWSANEVERRSAQVTGAVVPEWVEKTQREFGGPVKTLVFSASVAHGEELCREFQQAGYDFRQVSYRDRPAKGAPDPRLDTIAQFRAGEILGLVSCEALSRGFDVPDVKCLIAARPYRTSLASHIQQVGRLMRASPGKDFGLLIDHSGNWPGFEAETRQFFADGCDSLDDGRLRDAKRAARIDRKDFACPGCGLALPKEVRICPGCGRERGGRKSLVEVEPGRLVEAPGVDGTNTYWSGDDRGLWDQIATIGKNRHPTDNYRAAAFARVQFKQMKGFWPKYPMPASSVDVEDSVRVRVKSQFEKWKRAKRSERRKAMSA